MKNKFDWLILIIEKRERKLLKEYLLKEKILPKNSIWYVSQDLGKFCIIKFFMKEDLITKISHSLNCYKLLKRKYQGEFILIDKSGDF